jgi:hypothetical protein
VLYGLLCALDNVYTSCYGLVPGGEWQQLLCYCASKGTPCLLCLAACCLYLTSCAYFMVEHPQLGKEQLLDVTTNKSCMCEV